MVRPLTLRVGVGKSRPRGASSFAHPTLSGRPLSQRRLAISLSLQFSSWSVFDRIWRLLGKEPLLGKQQSLKPTQVAEIEQPIDHALRDVVRARIIDLLAASKDKPVVQAEHSASNRAITKPVASITTAPAN
jgi:hypothetical protein